MNILHDKLKYKKSNGEIYDEDMNLVSQKINQYGYKSICKYGIAMLSHRFAMEKILNRTLKYGEEVDHINGLRDDNRACNLRLVNRTENMRNKKRSKRNKSGCTGVSLCYSDNGTEYWQVHISGKSLGKYKCYHKAKWIRKKAEVDMGYHENHDREQNGIDGVNQHLVINEEFIKKYEYL